MISKRYRWLPLLILLLIGLAACRPWATPTAVPTLVFSTATPSPAPTPTFTLTPTPTPRPPALFVEPDDGSAPLLALIQSARTSLDVTVYLITHQEVVRALGAAARRGVHVRVLLEQHPYGGGESNRRAAEALRKAGVKVRFSSPAFRYTHQKSLIVDGSTAAILTMNFTHSSFTRNREYGVILHEPRYIAEMKRVFDADWERVPPTWGTGPLLVWSPVNSRDVILRLLHDARSSLLLEEQDLVDEEVVQALIAAVQRGVNVRLVRPPLREEEEAERRNVRRLQQAGGKVHVLSSPYVHAKVIVVDGRTALIGSINLTPTSLDLNRELGVIVQDPTIVQRVVRVIERDWQRGRVP